MIKKIKAIFVGYKTPKCVGLDLGTSATRMVELGAKDLKVVNYSFKEMQSKLISESAGINDVEQLSEHILDQWNLFKAKYKSIAISIPHHAVISKNFEIPLIKNKYKRYEFVKNLIIKDLDVDQIDFDYTIIKTNENTQLVSTVIAKKEKIEEYQAMIQMTGLNIAAIDVESYSVAHLLNLLVARYQIIKPTVFLSVSNNLLKAYVYINGQYTLYRDLDANINQMLLDMWLDIGGQDKIEHSKLFEQLNNDAKFSSEIAGYISDKISILLSMISNNLLLDSNIELSNNTQIYLFGGNSIVNGLIERLNNQGYSTNYFDVLLPENQHIARDKLLRLIEAISLATWGKSNVA